MWILRWPAALLTLAVAILCALLAAGAAADRLGLMIDHEVWRAFALQAANTTWIENALWAGASLFFLIAAVRLMRRSFGFWAWAIGFALYGARWWMMRRAEGGLPVDIAEISSVEEARAAAVTASGDPGLVALAALAVLGLVILIIDAADRAYRNRDEA